MNDYVRIGMVAIVQSSSHGLFVSHHGDGSSRRENIFQVFRAVERYVKTKCAALAPSCDGLKRHGKKNLGSRSRQVD
jgi:hypothetical protein